jgi:hypothetical protein
MDPYRTLPAGPSCGRMSDSDFDPVEVLTVLATHGVRFVLIGGLAGSARGSPVITGDVDLCYARDMENLKRLAAALQELGARLRGRGVPPDLPFQLDAATLDAGDMFTFTTSEGPVDILGTPSGTRGFGDLDAGATDMVIGGVTVRVAALDDLIRMKAASGRMKDLEHLEWLRAIRQEGEEAR